MFQGDHPQGDHKSRPYNDTGERKKMLDLIVVAVTIISFVVLSYFTIACERL